MHALAVLSLVASTALVAAQQETYAEFRPLSTFGSPLEARQQQSCASVGGKACGSKCIQLTYSCCGNGQGACEPGYTCGIAANGIYGCCPIGKRCRGDAPEPSTTIIGGSRPTSSADTGDDDEPTTTRAAPTSTTTTTRRLTPASTTSSRTTAVASNDEPSSTAVATSGSGSSGSGSGSSGSGSGSSGSGNSNSNGSGSGSGSSNSNGNSNSGGNAPASSAGIVRISLASIAGGLIAAVASLL
ncbi:hypothetical protein V2A60_005510 [Cordyceps javanica]